VKDGNNRFGCGHRQDHEKKEGNTESKCEKMNAAIGAVERIGIVPKNIEKRIFTAHRTGISHLVGEKSDHGTTDRNIKDKQQQDLD